ncbi:hypothetical protein MMC27_004338 [Xylographa pallens]|nr:hypothetical protein [Xylographa pallens]
MTTPIPPPKKIWYEANCHCGAVRYKVLVPRLEDFPLTECNCSICTKNGYINLYPKHDEVVFHQGFDTLKGYHFGSKQKTHKFCPECGSSILIDFNGTLDGKFEDAMAVNLNEAYETLGDANRRVLYNAGYPGIRAKHASEAQERQRQESARAAAENVRSAADSAGGEREQWQDLQRKRAEAARIEKAGLTGVELEIQKLEMQIHSLDKTAKESLNADKQGDTWWDYLTGWGRTAENIEKEKTKRQQEILQRLASERIKMAQLTRDLERFQQSKNAQLKIMRESELKFKVLEAKALREQRLREDAIRRKAAEESAREEAVRQKASEELAARRREEWRRQQEEWKTRQEERIAKAKAAEEERKERERLARERTREAARMKRDAAEKAELEAELARQEGRSQRTVPVWAETHGRRERKDSKPRKSSSCVHSGFWPKVQGRNQCSVCSQFFNLFVLQCPSCHRLACASCRKEITSRSRR